MVAASSTLAFLLGVLSIAQLVVVSMLTGFARVFFDVGYPSYLPAVIGKDRLLAGNSSMETIRASGEFVGPRLGGWLVSVLGTANVIMVQAVAFLVSAGSLLAIGTSEPARTLALSPTAIGLILAAGSIASMLAAAATPRLSRRWDQPASSGSPWPSPGRSIS